MKQRANRQVRLKSRPPGIPQAEPGRLRDRHVRLAGLRRSGRQGDPAQGRRLGLAHLDIAWRPWPQRSDGLFRLADVGQPKPGDTVVVSTAAGAVGSCVGQIAKIKGCRTVGIAGGPDKVRLCLAEYRYEAAVDYRAEDFDSAFDAACPGGVDVHFDNTAGRISDAVMRRLNVGARVVVCDTASIPSWDPPPQGPRVERLSRGHSRGNRTGARLDRRDLPRREPWQASDKNCSGSSLMPQASHRPGHARAEVRSTLRLHWMRTRARAGEARR